jgi:hypothetical protein
VAAEQQSRPPTLCSGVQERFGETRCLVFGDVVEHRGNFMERRATEASGDIRIASVENELKAAQICSAVEVFVASVKPGDVVPK